MNTLKKVNYIFTGRQKIRLVILFFMTIIAGLLETLGVSAVLPLISVIMSPQLLETNDIYSAITDLFNIQSVSGFIIFASAGLIIVYILKNVYLMMQYNIQLRFNYNCKRDVSSRLMKCYISQDYLFHSTHNVAELNRNVTGDVGSFFNMVQAFFSLAAELITCIFILVYLLIIDAVTTLFLLVILVLFISIVYRILKYYQIRAGEAARKTSGRISKWVLQTFGGIKEIKALNREKYFYDRYVEAYKANNEASKKSQILSRYPKYILETVFISSLLIVVCIRIQSGVDITAFATSLSAFVVAAVRLMPSFNRITEYIGTIMYCKTATDNVYNDLKEQERLDAANHVVISGDGSSLTFCQNIVLNNINFTYDGGTKKIFDDANIEINKYESVAFIGSSGAGKTTLADILLGLIRPNSGEVLVDDRNIYNNLNSWHRLVGYIPQNIYLMDDSIRNNILFGLKYENDDKIWKCLQLVQIDEFVRNLPDGIDTEIGDRGIRLSGGQRQRIGIARALYNEPELLVLDEATSALDNETEAAVMEAVENLHGKTTMVIIAHRLSTITHCDKIYEVRDGKIEERNKEEVIYSK